MIITATFTSELYRTMSNYQASRNQVWLETNKASGLKLHWRESVVCGVGAHVTQIAALRVTCIVKLKVDSAIWSASMRLNMKMEL